MARERQDFIPRPACTRASGECFYQSRCLGRCQPMLGRERANVELAAALKLLQSLRDYVISLRSVTRYVSGSNIDNTVNDAGRLLTRNHHG